ncbi:MAG: cation diffusion facilitator family transporter [Alphaproteobacteria bacterium]
MVHPECRRCRDQAMWLDLYVSIGLAIFKSVMGVMTGSMALSAHGLHSFADFLTKGIVLVSTKVSSWPATRRFPYGYGKIQFLSSAFVGLSLLLGSSLFLFSNIEHINKGLLEVPSPIAIAGALVAALASTLMYRYLHCVGVHNNSAAIAAAALENRSDALSAGAVLVGVLFANIGWPVGDHLAAIVVSFLVLKAGLSITTSSFSGLMDASVPAEVIDRARRIALQTEGVSMVADVRGRKLGETWEIDIIIAVAGEVSLLHTYEVTRNLRRRIHAEIPHTGDIRVSLVPDATRLLTHEASAPPPPAEPPVITI